MLEYTSDKTIASKNKTNQNKVIIMKQRNNIFLSILFSIMFVSNATAQINKMIPARETLEQIGFVTEWNAETKTAIFKNTDYTVSVTAGNEYFEVNGKKITFTGALCEKNDLVYNAPAIINDRFYLPENELIQEINSDKQKETDVAYRSIPFKFGSKEECIDFFKQNDKYYNSLTQTDLNWRMRKKGASVEEYKKYAYGEILDFSDEETLYFMERLGAVQDKLNALGYNYTLDKQIVFFKTTTCEEMDAGAYTFENYVFLGEWLYDYYKEHGEDINDYVEEVLAHEIFHVLTRNDPDFRAKIYKAINFEIGEEPDFSKEVNAQLLSNPDVEKFDCYSYFTLNGKKKKGTVVSYFSSDYVEDEEAFDYIYPGIVFYDEPNKIYPAEEIPDFYEVLGKNTDYVIAAEECIADNFSFAVVKGMNDDYNDPQIIEYIIKVLNN